MPRTRSNGQGLPTLRVEGHNKSQIAIAFCVLSWDSDSPCEDADKVAHASLTGHWALGDCDCNCLCGSRCRHTLAQTCVQIARLRDLMEPIIPGLRFCDLIDHRAPRRAAYGTAYTEAVGALFAQPTACGHRYAAAADNLPAALLVVRCTPQELQRLRARAPALRRQ